MTDQPIDELALRRRRRDDPDYGIRDMIEELRGLMAKAEPVHFDDSYPRMCLDVFVLFCLRNYLAKLGEKEIPFAITAALSEWASNRWGDGQEADASA